MSTLPAQLLEQARQLAQQERGRPRQASLRRAISTAYYALFHLLVGEASRSLAKGADKRLSTLVARAFVHEEMASACRAFASEGLPALITTVYGDPSRQRAVRVPQALKDVSAAFVALQKARHQADYAMYKRWTRVEAINEIERAEYAFTRWESLRAGTATSRSGTWSEAEAVNVFLLWLALHRKLQGR